MPRDANSELPAPKPSGPLLLLALAAFLAPILGGRVYTEAQPLEPGFRALAASVLTGAEAPSLGHAAVALLTGIALAWHWAANRVVQVPFGPLLGSMLLFLAALGLSCGFTEFPWLSLGAIFSWTCYGAAFFAAASIAGRTFGPLLLLGALAAGTFIVAADGVLGYWKMLAIDPTWRIFANWTNPNALAGMLLLGVFAALGLAASLLRVAALAAGAGAAVMGFALLLTQSKGGLAAAAVGGAAICLAALLWGRPAGWRLVPFLRWAAVGAAVLAILGVSTLRQRSLSVSENATGVLARVTGAGATAEQSAGFRKLLWQSSIQLILENPAGRGLGTFRGHSARPGLNTQTHFAHNSFLELGVEAGAWSPLLLAAVGALWLRECFRGARGRAAAQSLLQAGVLAAVLSGAAHSFVDSDLSYFGTGFSLFLLLGIGLSLSADALTPEQLPKWIRLPTGALALGAALGVAWSGVSQAVKGRGLHERNEGMISSAREAFSLARNIAPWDSEAHLLGAYAAQQAAEIARLAERAAELGPTPRIYRFLARALLEEQRIEDAESALRSALRWDPNNLQALDIWWKLLASAGRPEEAENVARRAVEIEDKPYFRIRAIPELVPTETFEARRFLASRARDARERAELLQGAVEGYERYMRITVPVVLRVARVDPTLSMGGETAAQAAWAMRSAVQAANDLRAAYLSLGKPSEAAAAGEKATAFESALSELDGVDK